MSIALSGSAARPSVSVGKQPASLLDMIFFALTVFVPLETILQAAVGAQMAFGRFMTPLFIVAFVLLRPPRATFRLPPGIMLIVPYFAIAFGHIALQGNWFGIYNYRTYVLNAVLAIAVFNYAVSNRPSPRRVLFATYVGIVLFSLWSIAGGPGGDVGRGGRFSMFELDENGLGCLYGMAVVIAIVLASRSDISLAMKAMLVAGALPCAGLLLQTGSRGALLSTVLGVFAQAVYLLSYRRRGGLLVGMVVVGAVFGVGKALYDRTDVMKERVARMAAESGSSDRFGHRDVLIFSTLTMIAEKPLHGWGEKAGWDELGRRSFGTDRLFTGTHNTYLLVLVTSGILAGSAFLWWILQPMFPRRRLLAVEDYASLYIVMVFFYGTFLTLDRLTYRPWWWMFPIFLAQGVVVHAAIRQKPSAVLSRRVGCTPPLIG